MATVGVVLLRCTARLIDLLGKRDLVLVDAPPGADDWYANLLWLDRRKCLLLTHAGTLFPVLVADVRKRDLQPPGPFVAAHVEAALADEKLPADLLGPLDPSALRIARTASRSILGFMNDSTLACRLTTTGSGANSSLFAGRTPGATARFPGVSYPRRRLEVRAPALTQYSLWTMSSRG